jgi:protein-S-isoprenylcysteine O-methyltransferase Ste14
MIIFGVVLAILSGIWIAYEIWLVNKDREQRKGGTQNDRGTRYLNFISLILGISGAAVLNGVSAFFFPGGRTTIVFWIGIGIMLLGFGLRIWSVSTLGESFRTTVETHSDQKVIKDGPYKRIRHPSYSGLLLMCLGYGIAVQNWLSLAVAVLFPLLALIHRIRIEEVAMLASMGSEYEEYRRRTKKIIPWVW